MKLARCSVPGFRAAAAIFALCLDGGLAFSATLTVTTTQDSGPGSLRQAILDANGVSGPHSTVFAITGPGVQTPVAGAGSPVRTIL